jgi:hypothetical protein
VDEKYAEHFNLTEANGEFSSSAVKKFIDDRIKDDEWNKVLKQSFDQCTASVSKSIDLIEKMSLSPPINLKKGECNIKLHQILGCTRVSYYAVSIPGRSQLFSYFSPIFYRNVQNNMLLTPKSARAN